MQLEAKDLRLLLGLVVQELDQQQDDHARTRLMNLQEKLEFLLVHEVKEGKDDYAELAEAAEAMMTRWSRRFSPESG